MMMRRRVFNFLLGGLCLATVAFLQPRQVDWWGTSRDRQTMLKSSKEAFPSDYTTATSSGNHHHQSNALLVNATAIRSTTHNTTKPTLLLHLGPPKTSTTFLQCILTNMIDTLALDNYVYLGIQIDVCKQKTPSSQQQPLLGHGKCYDLFVDNVKGTTPQFNSKFLHDLRTTHQLGKNVIIMNECFQYFTPGQTKLVIAEFATNWNVKLVVNYRRAYEFLPSYYNQGAKPKITNGNPALFLWPGQQQQKSSSNDDTNNDIVGKHLLPFDIDKRGWFSETFRDFENHASHPVQQVRQQYGQAFPDMTIIKLHELDRTSAGDAVLQEMFCHIVNDDMPHSCAAVQLDSTVKIGDIKRNSYYSFNYDILATAAYEKGLFGFQQETNTTTTITPRQHDTSRSAVVKMIQHHQEVDLNLTHHDFDTRCLSKAKMNRLLNASITCEKIVYGDGQWTRQDRARHEEAFLDYQDKKPYIFCSIDTKKTLQDPEWLSFLASI